MNASQLKETTMDPKKRMLLRVEIGDGDRTALSESRQCADGLEAGSALPLHPGARSVREGSGQGGCTAGSELSKEGARWVRYPLRRYSNLAATIHPLRSRCLTLLEPYLWDDRNDAFYMARIQEDREGQVPGRRVHDERAGDLSSLAGLCARHRRRLHSVRQDRLAAQIPPRTGFRLQSVDYRHIAEVESDQPRTQDLPFLKRLPYEDEKEFRLIFSSAGVEADTHDLPIDLGCIPARYPQPLDATGLWRSQ